MSAIYNTYKSEVELDAKHYIDSGWYDLDDIELVVTGNDNGSYFIHSQKARDYVVDMVGTSEFKDIAAHFGYDFIGNMFVRGDWEGIDVCIRLYVFDQIREDLKDYIANKKYAKMKEEE